MVILETRIGRRKRERRGRPEFVRGSQPAGRVPILTRFSEPVAVSFAETGKCPVVPAPEAVLTPSRPTSVRPVMLVGALLLIEPPAAGVAQVLEVPTRAETRIIDTGRFALYSDFRFNLHDFLHWRAMSGGPSEAGAACLAELDAEARAGWERADAWYRAETADRDARTDPLLRSIRFDIAGLDSDEEAPPERALVYELLSEAAPAYRACFWEAHDTRNRAWIASLEVLLDQHQQRAIERLETVYEDDWPDLVPVDVVGYSNWAGANTTGQPLHVLVSSADEDIQGPGALEMLLHEASHGVLGPGFGTVTGALERALRPHGLRASRDFWHAVLFYSSGSVTKELLATSYPAYELYMRRGRGVYTELGPALDAHWAPFIAAEIDLVTAAEGFAAAVAELPPSP